MSAGRVLLIAGVLGAAAWTASSARTPLREPPVTATDDDSSRAGPDSARVATFLGALAATDRVVCEMVADQVGNFWSDEGPTGIGRFADATPGVTLGKDSLAGRVRDPRAIVLLTSTLAADDACVRRLAAKMLGRSAVKTERIVQLLGEGAPRVREAAAYALGAGERKEARQALERAVESGGADQATPAMAAWALGEIRDAASIPVLVRSATSADARVRAASVRGLGELGDASTASALADAVDDRDGTVRVAAAHALGELHDVHVAPASLVRAAASADPTLRRAASHALAEIADPATLSVFVGFLSSPDRTVRREAVHAIGEIGSAKAAPDLIRMLKDPDAAVRKAAAEVLGELKSDR